MVGATTPKRYHSHALCRGYAFGMPPLFILSALLGLHPFSAAPLTAHGTSGKLLDNHPIVIPLTTGTLAIDPLTDRTVRIRFSRSGVFKPQRVPVLVGTNSPVKADMKTTHKGQVLSIDIGKVSIEVNKIRESITIRDENGNTLLQEEPASRRLTPVILSDSGKTQAYRISQSFILDSGEGIYGLGQHQDGLLNYRRSVVKLEQSNREIAIPFLVSSKGYGLLWNTPSHTDVNVALKEKTLAPVHYQDEVGQPGKFTVRYYTGQNFERFVSQASDPGINHEWSHQQPAGLPKENFSVRWTGFIEAPETGIYQFKTIADDGVRLFIDDKPIINNWEVHPATLDVASIRLEAKSRHKFRLEYFQGGGGAEIRMTCNIQQPTNTLKFDSEAADNIDYCVFYGPTLDGVISEYRKQTGQAPLPPKTALGFWQSKERYSSQQEWIDIASEYRKRKHPIDNLVQDWFYWDPAPWGSHKFDPARYPDPAAGIASLHRDYHLQFMISVWGKFIEGSTENPNDNFKALSDKGYLYPGLGSTERYYDAFNPDARQLYWKQMNEQIFQKGVDAWWLDASEPELDMQGLRSVTTAAGPGALVLNAWPLMHTVGVSKGQLKTKPDKRVFILTRSAFAGQQRSGAACWSGDITATWQVYANQIPAGLNFCLSGIPYWTTDIGAFFVPGNLYPKHAADPRYRELFTRWFQYGAFCPIFRVHGTDFAKEMWRFGPATETILNDYDELRYRLMPYIYSQAGQVSFHGGTIMRALVMDFPDDSTARELKDEFMFGPSLLVCPVIESGAKSRSVYLPLGSDWTDFWTGTAFKGGQTIKADAPISKIPLFVKSGSILPMGPVMQYVDEKAMDPLEVRVYGGADGSFTFYEDEGTNNNYRLGQKSEVPFNWDDRQGVLTIGARKGSFPGMLASRTFRVVFVHPGQGGSKPIEQAKIVRYDGTSIRVR